MMTRHSILLTLTVAAVLFAACSSEENEPIMPDVPDTPETPAEGYRFTFDGDVGTAASRASWTDDKGSGNLIFRWDYTEETGENEMVMAFMNGGLLASKEGNYHTYATINPHSLHSGDAHWAVFETVEKYEHDMPSGQYDGYKVLAVTPYRAENTSTVASSADTFSATLPMPATFTQAAGQKPEFLSNYMYMYATNTIANGGASLQFKHIPATFRFIITNKRPAKTTIIKSVQVSLADATQPVASQSATVTEAVTPSFSSGTYTKVTTLLGESGTAVQKDDVYTAYALVLPLASNTAFSGKKLQFTIEAGAPDNEYLSYVLEADRLAGVNPNGEYNWVGGKSYTIRMSLSDVLTFEGITVTDWTSGGTVNGGEAEEAE
ncbi:MAG: hypothetical protein IJ511_05990 [Bacteroides sp.]|nr:hypothetical protein [Bacteroides sp.]